MKGSTVVRKTVDEWRPKVESVLEVKVNEFKLMGFPKATRDELWECLQTKVWKGNPTLRIHEVVQDIFHLNTAVYMSYLTMSAYKDDDLMASIVALTKK